MINLPLNKLKEITKSRSIKDYKNKFKEYVTKILSESKPKITLFFLKKKKRYKKDFSKLRHSLRHGFSKSKINEFIRILYNIKTKKDLPTLKIKQTKKNLSEVGVQSTMQINFTSHKDSQETRTMYTKIRNIEITEGDETDKIIE